jgi:hypothetical protein
MLHCDLHKINRTTKTESVQWEIKATIFISCKLASQWDGIQGNGPVCAIPLFELDVYEIEDVLVLLRRISATKRNSSNTWSITLVIKMKPPCNYSELVKLGDILQMTKNKLNICRPTDPIRPSIKRKQWNYRLASVEACDCGACKKKTTPRVCCACKKKMLDLTNPNPSFPNQDSMGITTNRKSSTILAPNHRLIQQYQQPTNFVNIQGVFGFHSKFPTSTENI